MMLLSLVNLEHLGRGRRIGRSGYLSSIRYIARLLLAGTGHTARHFTQKYAREMKQAS